MESGRARSADRKELFIPRAGCGNHTSRRSVRSAWDKRLSVLDLLANTIENTIHEHKEKAGHENSGCAHSNSINSFNTVSE
jgi:hypothetical protein